MKGIIGRKLGMTRIFDETGRAVSVTVIEAGPCPVIRVKAEEKDGYRAAVLGYGRVRRASRPYAGQFKNAEGAPSRLLREMLLADGEDAPEGEVRVDIFSAGEYVDVRGRSKGHGFTGGIKRWGFHRGPMTHGSKYHRGPGSLSSRMSGGGGKVFKGRRLPGHYGNERVTVQALQVIRVDADRNLLLVRGAVPGVRGAIVEIRQSVKRRGKKA
ncbi:MAG: 50S ribosomal protein L3 [Thermaerobacter sp.]|nr:50S ribosomal protein L3 [Thermaerobacter sp.]